MEKAWGTKLKISFATDSRINGGSRSNSFLNKPKFTKIWKAIFVHFFLFLGVKHFCASLSQINDVQKSVLIKKFSKIRANNQVPTNRFWSFALLLDSNRFDLRNQLFVNLFKTSLGIFDSSIADGPFVIRFLLTSAVM